MTGINKRPGGGTHNGAMLTQTRSPFSFATRLVEVGGDIVPVPLLALATATLGNIALGLDSSLMPLSGRRVCLEFTQPSIKLGFVIHMGRLWPAPALPWEVCIRGDAASFLALLLQTEDADALFFDRRLAIEGDTALGLHLRHALDKALYRRQKLLDKILSVVRPKPRS